MDLHITWKQKPLGQAPFLVDILDQKGICASRNVIHILLCKCREKKDLNAAKQVHSLMVRSKLDNIPSFIDQLIRVFATCGGLTEADTIFQRVAKPSMYTWNSIISAHSKLGTGETALRLFQRMQQSGLKPDRITFLSSLKSCGMLQALDEGRLIHDQIVRNALGSDATMGSALIDMYAKCGDMEDAQRIFDDLPSRDVVVWGALLSGYAHNGNGFRALNLFKKMELEGIVLNKILCLSVLKACSCTECIEHGKDIHCRLVETGFDTDPVVGSSLIDMYSKCTKLEDAEKVFRTFTCRDAPLWGAIIAGYAQCGLSLEALNLFEEMLVDDLKPTKPMALCVLKACGTVAAVPKGRLIHDQLVRNGLESDTIVGNAVLDMYAKCGSLDEAERVFNQLLCRDAVSWASLMAGYLEHGSTYTVFVLFDKMGLDEVRPDKVIFLCMLKACAALGDIARGKSVHVQIHTCRLTEDSAVSNALIDMYVKCGSMEEALHVFDKLECPDDISCGAVISGYALFRQGWSTLDFFKEMEDKRIMPGRVMYFNALRACCSIGDIEYGRLFHDQIIKNGYASDEDIGSMLINMYSKCGNLEEARRVFAQLLYWDETSCGIIITAHSEQGYDFFAFELFDQMLQDCIITNKAISLYVLRVCSTTGDIRRGRMMHDQVCKVGLDLDVSVGNSIITMYMKCQGLEEGCQVFDILPIRDEMSWGNMIAGYVFNGASLVSCNIWGLMQDGLKCSADMFICILKACTSMETMEQGMLIHYQIMKAGLEIDLVVGSSLIDMYAKCGSLEDACKVFNALPAQDLVTCSSMITGFLQHGENVSALELFKRMQWQAIKPDTLLCLRILKVCGTLGATIQGRLIHDEIIRENYESVASVRSALISMYIKCCCPKEAQIVFDAFHKDNALSWGAALAGQSRYGDCRLALHYFEELQNRGLRPTEKMLSCVLAACSHAGLLDEGCRVFKYMTEGYGITPTVEHFNCMIDLLGRAGCLTEAADFLRSMPLSPDIIGWRTLLTGCRMHGNISLGKLCHGEVTHIEPSDASGYVIMTRLYAEAHLSNAVENIQAGRKSASAPKKPGRAWIEVNSMVHEFVVGCKSQVQDDETFSMLDWLSLHIRRIGFMPQVDVCLEHESDDSEVNFERVLGVLKDSTSIHMSKNSSVYNCDNDFLSFTLHKANFLKQV